MFDGFCDSGPITTIRSRSPTFAVANRLAGMQGKFFDLPYCIKRAVVDEFDLLTGYNAKPPQKMPEWYLFFGEVFQIAHRKGVLLDLLLKINSYAEQYPYSKIKGKAVTKPEGQKNYALIYREPLDIKRPHRRPAKRTRTKVPRVKKVLTPEEIILRKKEEHRQRAVRLRKQRASMTYEQREAYKAKRRESAKQYRRRKKELTEAELEKRRERMRQNYHSQSEEQREARRQSFRRYYENNKKAMLARAKAYYEKVKRPQLQEKKRLPEMETMGV